MPSRSPLFRGLCLTLRHPRPFLWAYVFNAAIIWLATLSLHLQFADITRYSLGAERLISGFDLGTVLEVSRRMSLGPHGTVASSFVGIPIYVLVFFLLVPGTLLTYQTNSSIRLSGLLQQGLLSFWSFVRITFFTGLIAGPILGILGFLQSAYSKQIDNIITGAPSFVLDMTGALVVMLVAAFLRLYFDLVEIHTVAQSQTLMANGKPDRRVRKTLGPARRTLGRRTLPTYLTFLLLTLLGAVAVYLCTFSALRHLAQPRVWPTFLLGQLGLFLLLFTRFWQRAAETVHYQNVNPIIQRAPIFAPPISRANPVPPPPLEPQMTPTTHYASAIPLPDPLHDPLSPVLPGPDPDPFPQPDPGLDPVPNPEPISPSLTSPDPGVFHHDVPPKKDLLN
ncbi:hypothetical protein [Granulicella sibirica]|uniref:Uncharacterized protein n=1 Tax=Granulicella sibirica TaxID=2479048 RepID=A0A4Q0T1E6_9BACT|nr:hypothetical protein [Granulicella sibirica]RXH57455.1 hypothetical protein GRAN_0765 [Granulicella sibirica]